MFAITYLISTIFCKFIQQCKELIIIIIIIIQMMLQLSFYIINQIIIGTNHYFNLITQKFIILKLNSQNSITK